MWVKLFVFCAQILLFLLWFMFISVFGCFDFFSKFFFFSYWLASWFQGWYQIGSLSSQEPSWNYSRATARLDFGWSYFRAECIRIKTQWSFIRDSTFSKNKDPVWKISFPSHLLASRCILFVCLFVCFPCKINIFPLNNQHIGKGSHERLVQGLQFLAPMHGSCMLII